VRGAYGEIANRSSVSVVTSTTEPAGKIPIFCGSVHSVVIGKPRQNASLRIVALGL